MPAKARLPMKPAEVGVRSQPFSLRRLGRVVP
jgi:hypothetical protein